MWNLLRLWSPYGRWPNAGGDGDEVGLSQELKETWLEIVNLQIDGDGTLLTGQRPYFSRRE